MEEQVTETLQGAQQPQEVVEDEHIIYPPFISQAREKRRRRM